MDTVRDLLYKAFPPPQQPLPLAPPTPDVATVIYWCIGQRCIELGTTSPRPDLDLAEKAEYYRLSQPMQWLLPSLILIWVMVALRSQLMPAYTYLFKGCSRVLQIPQIAAEIIGLSKLPALAIDFARRRTAAFKHSGDRQRKDQQDAGIVGDNQIPEIQPSMMRGSRILREISDEQSSDDTMILRNYKLKCNACPILDSPDDERSVSRQNSSSILDNPVDQGSL